MMTRRWKFFRENGELRARQVNPPLIIANPRKGKSSMPKTITMKRNRFGQFVKARSSNPRPHHKKKNAGGKRKHNYYGGGAIVPVNPPHHKKGKGRRRNPPSEVLGVPIPNMQDTAEMTLGVAGGLAGPPIANGLLNTLLPSSITSMFGTAAPTLISVISYLLPPLIGNAIGGRQAAKYVIAGELAGLLVPTLNSLASSITSSLTPATSAVAGYVPKRAAGFSGFGRAAVARHGNVRQMHGYLMPTPKTQMSGFPFSGRSATRQSRFTSPRR